MTAKKCDRCGKFYERAYVPNIAIKKYINGHGDQRYDLCDDCQQQLEKWLSNKKPPKYAEIFKLAAQLAERGIPFEFECLTIFDLKKCYLWCPDAKQDHVTVTQGTDTKGFEDGLLEIKGLLYPKEAERNGDGRLGWLTAENVLERILKMEAEKC